MINPQWLELPMSRTNFHGPKDVHWGSTVYFKMLHCTWMVCWIANDTLLFRANCFPTDRVISNWNRCSHIHWPIYLLHWNMDQKTEIRSYIKCRIRLNIDSKQIFNELCGIYGPQTISVRTVLGGLKLLKLGNFLLKMIPVLEGLKPLLSRLTSLL